MCVIIYSKIGTEIEYDILKEAWETNPHGGGFAVIENEKIHYEKGFMEFIDFIEAFDKYNNPNYEKVIHFRITSIGTTTKEQTHPFKKANPNKIKYTGNQPVYFMNGTITDIKPEAGLNDTATYIKKYKNGIRANQQGINLLAGATGAKWAVATTKGIFISNEFIEKDNLYYSNLNHEHIIWINTKKENYSKYEYSINELIQNKKLRKQIYKDKNLTKQLRNFIKYNCNEFYCYNCPYCISEAVGIEELKDIIFYWQRNQY